MEATAPHAPHPAERPRHVAVVGGGVTGLSAAHELRRQGLSVTVLEAAAHTGGKVRAATVAGVLVDTGAESLLARRPEALALVAELGMSEQVTHPAENVPPRIYSRGALRALPAGQLMGVPSRLLPLLRSGILSPAGRLRAARDWVWPAARLGADIPVAEFVGARMGREVVTRLVEPLLGGVYAGSAANLSLEATLPEIAAGARAGYSARDSARRALAERPSAAGPVFATVRGGLGRFVKRFEARLAADERVSVSTRATVRELRRQNDQWALTVGSAANPRQLTADGVVLACPPVTAARLLATEVPTAAAPLSEVATASMAVVVLAYPRHAVPATMSGFLVPPDEARTVKAVTFSSVKWPWLAAELDRTTAGDEPLALVRCSVGRLGEEASLQRSDAELVAAATSDLAATCGISATPRDSHVARWGGALPQYDVGHHARIARARAALRQHPGLGACGAAFDGVGIAACVADGRATARDVAAQLMGEGAGPDTSVRSSTS